MNNYNITGSSPSIDYGDVKNVKEMIFNKAREKSLSLVKDSEEQMTSSIQNDVMDNARNSISSSRMKPFGLLTKTQLETPLQEEVSKTNDLPQLKHNVQSVDNSVYTASMRNETMDVARNQFSRKPTLMETLNFLNTQAAIKMVSKTHSKIVWLCLCFKDI